MTETELHELDKEVAEKVMGQTWQGGSPIPNYDGRWPWPPPYSTDIAAAWLVLELLISECGGCFSTWSGDGGDWACVFGEDADDEMLDVETRGAISDSAPLAICRAALKSTQQQEA
jgi:hypothetical protein